MSTFYLTQISSQGENITRLEFILEIHPNLSHEQAFPLLTISEDVTSLEG